MVSSKLLMQAAAKPQELHGTEKSHANLELCEKRYVGVKGVKKGSKIVWEVGITIAQSPLVDAMNKAAVAHRLQPLTRHRRPSLFLGTFETKPQAAFCFDAAAALLERNSDILKQTENLILRKSQRGCNFPLLQKKLSKCIDDHLKGTTPIRPYRCCQRSRLRRLHAT